MGEAFATYGPQNTATRALRKHQGRTLNANTSHQFTVTRANALMRETHAAQKQEKEERAEKQRQRAERLKLLDARAKRTVAQFATSPNKGGAIKAPSLNPHNAPYLRPTASQKAHAKTA